MCNKLYILAVALVLLHISNVSGQDIIFWTWLQKSMTAYPEWLIKNHIDPSPVNRGPLDLSDSNDMIQLDIQISNYFVGGISGPILYVDVSGAPDSYFYFNFGTDGNQNNLVLEGDYRANGTVMDLVSIAGSGKFKLAYSHYSHQPSFSNFDVTSDGHIKLSDAQGNFNYFVYPADLLEFKFDGLLDNVAGAIADQVKETITKKFNEKMSSNERNFPGSWLLFTYFNELFERTPLANITIPRP